MKVETKYCELLQKCGIVIVDDKPIYNKYGDKGVTIDNIHDAIIYNGVDMELDVGLYKHKAEQLRKDNYRKNSRNVELEDKLIEITAQNYDESALYSYGFSEDELLVAESIINGVPDYKIPVPRRYLKRLKESIEAKLWQSGITPDIYGR